MNNRMLFCVYGALALLMAPSVQADELENQYKEALISQAAPAMNAMLEERFKNKGMNESEITFESDRIVAIFAECNVKALGAYDPRFKAVAFESVANGGSWADSKQDLSAAFGAAMQSGELTEAKFMEAAEASKRIFTDCAREGGLNFGN